MVFTESTSTPRYWMPLQASIFIYPMLDSTYNPANRLYTFNGDGTDTGTIAKPVSLQFESTIGNVGTFTLEIEDSTYTLNPDTFSRGCRVFVSCSKNAQSPQSGFKGLVRSVEQKMYGQSGRNLVIKGYSSLIRLKERIVDFVAFDFTTFSLIDAIMTDDNAYLYTSADESLYFFLRNDNTFTSGINQTIPRAEMHLSTVDQALANATEHTNSLIAMDFDTDQLILYNSDDILADNQVFTLTDKLDMLSDRADTTMYPLEPYTYSFGYDYPDSASRLVASIGSVLCNPSPTDGRNEGGGGGGSPNGGNPAWLESIGTGFEFFDTGNNLTQAFAQPFVVSSTPLDTMKFGLFSIGNISYMNSIHVKFFELVWDPSGLPSLILGAGLSGWIPCYYHSNPALSLPSTDNTGFWIGFQTGQAGFPPLTPNTRYWVALKPNGTINGTNQFAWLEDVPNNGWVYSSDAFVSNYTEFIADYHSNTHEFRMDYLQGIVPDTGGCGGLPVTVNAVPNFMVAADMNGVNRIGMIEKTVTGLPQAISNQDAMNEYLFNKIYTSAKPKFRFDYPAVTLPNIMPRAGDIVVHSDSRLNVGVRASPIQTGIISNVNYDFRQDEQGVLGLTRIAISTSGVVRGRY